MKRKMRKFAEGGQMGYKENLRDRQRQPTQPYQEMRRMGVPLVQSDEEIAPNKSPKKPSKIRKEGRGSRKVSSMEFIRNYEDSPASSRIREEAASAVKKSKQTSMTPDERAEAVRKGIIAAGSLVNTPAALGASLIRTAKRRYDEVDEMRSGGAVKSSASRRADGIAKKGKTRGKFV